MSSPDPKIIDLISQSNGGKPFLSLEYFPPRTDDGVKVGRWMDPSLAEAGFPAFLAALVFMDSTVSACIYLFFIYFGFTEFTKSHGSHARNVAAHLFRHYLGRRWQYGRLVHGLGLVYETHGSCRQSAHDVYQFTR